MFTYTVRHHDLCLLPHNGKWMAVVVMCRVKMRLCSKERQIYTHAVFLLEVLPGTVFHFSIVVRYGV